MNARSGTGALLLAAATLALAGPLSGQRTIGVSTFFQGYSFDKGLGADAAQLLMIPVGIRYPLGNRFTLDFYGAWAQGKVERNGVHFDMTGVVDSRIKASYQAASGVLLGLSVNLPTGNATHTTEEAIVAAVLSTDLLGFREASFGTGLGITSSVATAYRLGEWGVGIAGSYAVRNEFEPRADTAIRYAPGNEVRVRLGIDRNIGTSGTLTGGVTFQTYTNDRIDGRNLFQAGNRIRGDASYQFRAGAGVWSVYATNLWRSQGDLTLDVADRQGRIVKDTTLHTGSQNIFAAGVIGAMRIGAYIVRPQVDFRTQHRSESGSDAGSGWIAGFGGDLPVRLFGAYDFFPRFRLVVGSIVDATGANRGVLGGEFSGTVRWSF